MTSINGTVITSEADTLESVSNTTLAHLRIHSNNQSHPDCESKPICGNANPCKSETAADATVSAVKLRFPSRYPTESTGEPWVELNVLSLARRCEQ